MDGLYPYRPFTFPSAPLEAAIQECRTVFYTPPVSASVARLEKEVLSLFAAFSYLVEAAMQGHQGREEFLVTRRFSHLIELLIVGRPTRHHYRAGTFLCTVGKRHRRVAFSVDDPAF